MAILKLYGSKHATSTKRVATILHELKVPFELIEVDAGTQKSPAFLAKQPFGQIPYIEEEDGFVLYETRAICRYIAAKYPASGLIPSEPKAHAIFEQAACTELTNFDPSASKLVIETVLMPMFYGTKADPAVVAEQLAILDKKLDAYDTILGKHRYIAGESLTLADLFHIPYAPLLAAGGIDIMTQKPNVARWYKELVARPSWLACTEGVTSTAAY
ncbi:glutathione S-transferase-like protein [Mycena rosella]|uniref:glutathione transferase n=1 Tax=Mycena rosella TaxID=1033263 RepID=A0AAD7MBA3_MYCRO|nr:glutathione S-transferase-like protein [Mycena rosella]